MTKLRELLTVEHVLSQVINKLEEDEVKNITNKSKVWEKEKSKQ